MSESYRDLGGLSRPDAYFGAIEFVCPTCGSKGRTLSPQFDGEKCRQWHERLQKWLTKRMPCVERIKLADKSSRIF